MEFLERAKGSHSPHECIAEPDQLELVEFGRKLDPGLDRRHDWQAAHWNDAHRSLKSMTANGRGLGRMRRVRHRDIQSFAMLQAVRQRKSPKSSCRRVAEELVPVRAHQVRAAARVERIRFRPTPDCTEWASEVQRAEAADRHAGRSGLARAEVRRE
jgi:hypothetical protein